VMYIQYLVMYIRNIVVYIQYLVMYILQSCDVCAIIA
jgi:hypothetical protein